MSVPAELRPPPEHDGKTLHWIETDRGNTTTWRWRDSCWTDEDGSHLYPRDADGCRYLGPAEWNPEAQRVAARLDAGAGAYHALSIADERIATLEADNALRQVVAAGLSAQGNKMFSDLKEAAKEIATLRDRLASAEAHNVELVAKYEALKASALYDTSSERLAVFVKGIGLENDVIDARKELAARTAAAFPANALGHGPKVVR